MGLIFRLIEYIEELLYPSISVEDSAEALDSWYRQQIEELQNLRRTIADVVTNRKRLELQQNQTQTSIDKYEQLARQALSINREDLARSAVERLQALQPQLLQFQQRIVMLDEQLEKFAQLEQQQTVYIEVFRTRTELLKAQQGIALAHMKIGKITAGFSEKIADFNMEAIRLRKSILAMKARLNAMNQMIEQGTLTEIGDLPTTDDIFDLQLNQIPSKANIDVRVAEIKQALPHESKTQPQSE